MKKHTLAARLCAVVLSVLCVGALAACGASASGAGGDKTIKVGASPTPHAEILNAVKDELAKDGYTLEVVEHNDYIQPNTALEDGQLDANYFQHVTYLNDFNEENGTHLVDAADIHFEPFGLYAGKTSSLDALPDGATVAVPNDTTNEARALLLLQQEGLIKLKDGAGLNATAVDIVENPKNLKIEELEAAQLPRSLQDVDLAAINGNYALGAGLKVSDALATESDQGEAAKAYANIVAVKDGNQDSEKTKALVKALTSETAKSYIDDTYNGAVVTVF
ncbi:MetQ/NlpA family ABC transporter substrate-binding protein [Atopobiaceae bacterium 24-176]